MPDQKEVTRLEIQAIETVARTVLSTLHSIETQNANLSTKLKEESDKQTLQVKLKNEIDQLTSWALGLPPQLKLDLQNKILSTFVKQRKKHTCTRDHNRELISTSSLYDLSTDSLRDFNRMTEYLSTHPQLLQVDRENDTEVEPVRVLTVRLANSEKTICTQKFNSLDGLFSIICRESARDLSLTCLSELGTLSPSIFNHFHNLLSLFIPQMLNLRELDLSNVNNKTCIPQITNDHMQLIGCYCQNLEVLNVSCHKNLTRDGLVFLGESKDPGIHSGCFKLKKLLIFDTGIFEKDVAKLVLQLPNLIFLGYKETGKVVKTLSKALQPPRLKLTHIDNRGSKARRLDYSSLRCKKGLVQAMLNLCPDVTNLKLRVAEDDVEGLARLQNVASVELIYHVGSIQTPGVGTQNFFKARGKYLTSIALYCQNMTTLMLRNIAENCTNLQSLWFRSNHFMPSSTQQDDLRMQHNYLTHLHTLYLRVGHNELYIVQNFPPQVLLFLLRNAPLKELILAIRSNTIKDEYLGSILSQPNLINLEKILFVIPGLNSIRSTLDITETTLDFILSNCRKIKKLGNLLSWNLSDDCKEELHTKIKDLNWDLEVIDKRMTMR